MSGIDSRKMNKEFSRQVKSITSEFGIAEHVAANVLRWKKSVKSIKPPKVRWYGLTDKQLTSPSVALADKVKYGTNCEESKYQDDLFLINVDPDRTWNDAVKFGMYHSVSNSILMTDPERKLMIMMSMLDHAIVESMMAD
jgi:hypothetical protein